MVFFWQVFADFLLGDYLDTQHQKHKLQQIFKTRCACAMDNIPHFRITIGIVKVEAQLLILILEGNVCRNASKITHATFDSVSVSRMFRKRGSIYTVHIPCCVRTGVPVDTLTILVT